MRGSFASASTGAIPPPKFGTRWALGNPRHARRADSGGVYGISGDLQHFPDLRGGDIRYYGLLKTIGVTPKQLRRLIRQQALLLSALGIPVGLLLGYGVGAAAVPITMSTSTMGGRYTTVSVSPWIFLFSSVFALLTVLLSCARPGRIAGRVSCGGGALHRAAVVGENAPEGRQGHPIQMAAANLGRDKKKTALVMVSLSLTVVLLNLLVTFIGGFDMDKYLVSEAARTSSSAHRTTLTIGVFPDQRGCGTGAGKHSALSGGLCLSDRRGGYVSAGKRLAG